MESKDYISILAVIVCLIAIVNFSVTIIKIASFNEAMTGYATGTGYVNVTITQNIAINVSRWQINWGSGTINTTAGCQNASFVTRGDGDPSIFCGNWTQTGGPKGIIIQNLGSVNFSLNVSGVQNALDFFGGTAGSYMFNLSQKEIGTCNTLNNGTGMNITTNFFEVTKGATYQVCKQFGYLSSNEMFMDIYMRVPADNNITDGTMRRDIITMTAYTAV